MSDPAPQSGLLATLARLRVELAASKLSLASADAAAARLERDSILSQLDDYVVPRLTQLDAPLLAVVGGSTGAGKSTLVNSVLGEAVSRTGVLRPTTRSAVLVHNPDDAEWFGADRLLPDLERTDRATGDPAALQLVPATSLPPGLALLDAPDVDSIEKHNRVLASQLLSAADLWLFVTSAARYADQVPWDYLKAAASRSTAVAVVLDRTPPAAVREVSSHLAQMMTARGLGEALLFAVPESALTSDGLLPSPAIRPIRDWLNGLAADSSARAAVIRKTLDGAIASLPARAAAVAAALDTQEQLVARLRADVRTAYADALGVVDEAIADGTLLRGEVLARWQEFVGTGELLRGLETRVGRLRDRLFAAMRGQPPAADQVTDAVESGLQSLIVEHAEAAAERAALAWRSVPAGAALLESTPVQLGRASRDLPAAVERTIRDWQGAVLDLVRSEGADRRTTARFLAYGVNSLGVALMMVIFASTAGVTGAEVGVAGGTAIVGQKVLEAVFGDQAVRRLAQQARDDLHSRVQTLWQQEQARFVDVLDAEPPAPGAAQRLRAVVAELSDGGHPGATT